MKYYVAEKPTTRVPQEGLYWNGAVASDIISFSCEDDFTLSDDLQSKVICEIPESYFKMISTLTVPQNKKIRDLVPELLFDVEHFGLPEMILTKDRKMKDQGGYDSDTLRAHERFRIVYSESQQTQRWNLAFWLFENVYAPYSLDKELKTEEQLEEIRTEASLIDDPDALIIYFGTAINT